MSYRYYWLLGRNSQSSLSRTGSEKGRRDFQSPNLFWDAICLVSLTWVYAICLEWLLPGISYQGQACLNFSSGLLEICKAVVLHLALAKEWKVFTLLQMCLSALPEASSLTLVFLLPIARKTLPSLRFRVAVPASLESKGSSSILLVYGTSNRRLRGATACSALADALSYWHFYCFSDITSCNGKRATTMISSSIWFAVAKSNSI